MVENEVIFMFNNQQCNICVNVVYVPLAWPACPSDFCVQFIPNSRFERFGVIIERLAGWRVHALVKNNLFADCSRRKFRISRGNSIQTFYSFIHSLIACCVEIFSFILPFYISCFFVWNKVQIFLFFSVGIWNRLLQILMLWLATLFKKRFKYLRNMS